MHLELCKLLEFNHLDKLSEHKAKSVGENEKEKKNNNIFRDFDLQTNHPIQRYPSATRKELADRRSRK